MERTIEPGSNDIEGDGESLYNSDRDIGAGVS